MDQNDSTEQGLYRPEFEHDSCGTGFITNIDGHKNYQIIDDALNMLENMEHRGACGCDPDSGDGAGILIQLPHEFFMEECSNLEISLPEPGEYGVGMLFLPKDSTLKKACRTIIDSALEKLGLPKLGYRKVVVNASAIGETAVVQNRILSNYLCQGRMLLLMLKTLSVSFMFYADILTKQ
jgi:glutamate synthase (NADPH/NADH) large chain